MINRIKKERRVFNLEYLTTLLKKDNAILVCEYSKLNSDIKITFNCSCTTTVDKLFRDIAYYGGAYCKECTKKNKANKIKKTCMELYGVDNPSYLEDIKKKKENTYMKHYGDHPKRIKEVQDKYVQTCLERYGCINSAQTDNVKNKIKDTFDKKYNGHTMFNQDIKNKVKDTCFKKYGGHPMCNETIKNKIKEACFKKYGGYPIQTQEVRNKIIITNLNKYGCHPSQTPEIMDKIMKSSMSYKKYEMPSGDIRHTQGYEPFALNILLKEYNEKQIKTERNDMPNITYTFNNKTKRYFPDIYIPDKNLIIEVKSEWIYNKQLELNRAKEKYTKEYGYTYEVWIFDRKGNRNIKSDDYLSFR